MKMIAKITNLHKGIGFSLLSFFSMALYGVFLNAASLSGLSKIWINFYAYFFGFLLLIPLALKQGASFFKTSHFSLHIGRALCGVISSILYIASLKYISLLNATLLFNTTPLFIPLFALIMLKEKITLNIFFSIIIGFIGVTFIINPNVNNLTQPGNLLALGAGIFLALGFCFVKLLTPTDSRNLITFYFCGISAFVQIPFLFFESFTFNFSGILWSLAAGTAMVFVQQLLATAYKYTEASKISVFQYSSLIFIGIIDWLVWSVIPTYNDYFGMLLITAGGVLIIFGGKKTLSRN